MKKILFIAAVLIFFAGQIFAQDTIPEEQIIVNKKYDKQGNLIQYDSTYVHQWSFTGDSTIQLAFPDDNFLSGDEFLDMEKFFREFMKGNNIPGGKFTPFDDDFFKHFDSVTPDSTMNGQFFAHRDTSFFCIPGDSLNSMPHGFMPDTDEIMQEIHEHFKNLPHNIAPRFKSEEQQKEWEQLMEKQRQEMEEFREKWEKKGQ